jgi:hypothetical protein
MDTIEEKTAELDYAYEPDYTVEDIVLSEPFVVMKPIGDGRPNWWGSRVKVESLIAGFKFDLTVAEACIQAGITVDQYKYFCKIHPKFLTVKARCKSYSPIVAKQGLFGDLKHPSGFRSRQWYLERKQPHIYGRDIGAYTPPPPDAAQKITAEAFLDEDGNVLVTRKMQEKIIKDYGDRDPEQSEDKPK